MEKSTSNHKSNQEKDDVDEKPARLPPRTGPTPPERHSGSGPGTPQEPSTRSGAVKRTQQGCSKSTLELDFPRDIHVTLTEVPFRELGKRFKYEALSYYWGTEDATELIHIRNDPKQINLPDLGQEEKLGKVARLLSYKDFFVKSNLYRALQNLRNDKDPVLFWVDALCIDQNNLEEKKLQVANMDKIYSQAERVLIWLGTGTERTKKAMNFIDEVIKLDRVNTLVADESRVNDWNNLLSLMRREWFSRRWVIQELALAKDAVVCCGDDERHWYDFRDAVSMFALKVDQIRMLFKRSGQSDNDYHAIEDFEALGAKVLVETINNVFRRAGPGESHEPIQGLEYLVSTLSTFESSDPRDTIHALRNIAIETSRPTNGKSRNRKTAPPKPDYSMDLLQVYIAFVKWVERTTKSIDIICRHWALPERDKPTDRYPPLVELPSWVQRISQSPFGRQRESRGRIHGDNFVGLPGESSYNASYGIEAEVTYGIDEVEPIPSPKRVRTKMTGRSHGSESHEPPAAPEFTAQNGRPLDTNTTEDSTVEEPTALEVEPLKVQKFSKASSKRHASFDIPDSEQRKAKAPKIRGSHQNNRTNSTSTKFPAVNATSEPRASEGDMISNGYSNSQTVSNSNKPVQKAKSKAEVEFERKWLGAKRRTIHVNGLRVGTLAWVTDPIPDGVIPHRVLKSLGQGTGSSQEPRESAAQWRKIAQNPPDKLWRTIVAERGDDGRNPPAWYYRACQHCLVNDSPNGHINTRDLLRKDQPDFVRNFLRRVQAVTWDRVFLELTTELNDSIESDSSSSEASSSDDEEQQGGEHDATQHGEAFKSGGTDAHMTTEASMNHESGINDADMETDETEGEPQPQPTLAESMHGLGPCDAQAGDIICILFGCTVPCVLRQQKDDVGEYFQLIGEAYIYGLMGGEALMSKSEKWIKRETQTFEIR